MRISAFAGLFCLLLNACMPNKGVKVSCLKSLIDSLKIDTTKNILIYTINPNDCISCINGFKTINNTLAEANNPKLYIFSVDREIEKEAILKSNPDLELLSISNESICWSRELFLAVNRYTKNNVALSVITIYNYKADSIVYSKPIREVSNENEIKSLLNTN